MMVSRRESIRSAAKSAKNVVTFRNLNLISLVVLLFLQFSTVLRVTDTCFPAGQHAQVSDVPESELSPQKELNAKTSSLTKRSFFYNSNRSGNEIGIDSFWTLEELKVVASEADSFSNTSNSNSTSNSDYSSKWSQSDVQMWCPQPVLSILESPKLVKARDYQHRTAYPESYANKDYWGMIRRWQQFFVPSANSSLIQTDSQNIVKAAVCRFHPERKHARHFPHAMEEIFVCIDYWIETGAADPFGASDKKPVFLYDGTTQEEVRERWQKNAFMKGILAILKEEMGVVMMTTEDYLRCAMFDNNSNSSSSNFHNTSLEIVEEMKVCKGIYHPDQTIRTTNKVIPHFFFQKDAEFNIYVDSFLRKKKQKTTLNTSPRNGTASTPGHLCAKPPRIGILNRESSRGIVNADQLADDLSELLYVYRKNDDPTTNSETNREQVSGFPVEVIFFENLSFVEQVEFFRRTDIVVSGHGAQLTGVPFLKIDEHDGRCKQVLELFPYDHVIPSFFGSLVVGTGMSHSYVYYDDGLRPATSAEMEDPNDPPYVRPPARVRPLKKVPPSEFQMSDDVWGRVTARRSNFCPRRDDMVDYLSELIFDWYRCHGC